MRALFLNLMERGGGPVMWAIFGVSVVIWTVGLLRWRFLSMVMRARDSYVRLRAAALEGREQGVPTGIAEFDELLRALARERGCTPLRAQRIFRQFLICIVPRIDRGFSLMSAWISVAPLLGLLGTVIGMIQTFRVITAFGVGNPALTAEGISMALLTTQAGLTVAFPGVLLQNVLSNRRARLIATLMKDGEELVGLLHGCQRRDADV